jgi:hypothetical protein
MAGVLMRIILEVPESVLVPEAGFAEKGVCDFPQPLRK